MLYKDIEKIDSGTFGQVFKVTTLDNEVHAVKVFNSNEQDVREEIDKLRKLQHRHVVRIYGCYNTRLHNKERKAMSMEYCPSNLRKAIRQGLTSDRASRLFTEILKGIDFIHGENYIHNDLKPENILLDHQDRVKIADFGLSRICRSPYCYGSLRGTLLYLPPEGENIYGSKTDMYSLGIILFEMNANISVTDRVNVISMLKKDPQSAYNKLSDGNDLPMIRKAITQLLCPDPEQRPTAREMLARFNKQDNQSIINYNQQQQQVSSFPQEVAIPLGIAAFIGLCAIGLIVFHQPQRRK